MATTTKFNEGAVWPVLREVCNERARQHAKWGEQNHPDVPASAHARYLIPTDKIARAICEGAFRSGRGTWGHILVEEVSEAVAAGEFEGAGALRAELVQVAAVCVAWVEAIDRRERAAAEARVGRDGEALPGARKREAR